MKKYDANNETEKRFHLLFSYMLEGFAYCQMLFKNGKPLDWIYLDVNPAFERLTGLRNLEGKKVSEVIPDIRKTNPELFDIYGRVASGGPPERFETFVPALNAWFSVSVYCPEKEHFVAVFEIITERKLAETKLREQEEFLKALSFSARDSIIVIDGEGKVIFWNPSSERMFGYSAGEMIGKKMEDHIIPPKYRDKHGKGIESFMGTGAGAFIGSTIELSGLKKNGEEFPIELSLASFQLDGKWHAVGIIRDITTRKAEVELLLRHEKLASIGTLSAGVAHEILNPLNTIGTIVQIMQGEELPQDKAENLEEIMVQIRRATKITNNLRMFAHQHKAEIKSVDVNALLDRTALLLEHDLLLDNIHIEKIFNKDVPLAFADEDLLAQVFLNILNNARHALQEIPDKKRRFITVTTAALNGMVQITISDTGAGIPKEIIGKIFDPFFTTKDPAKGTGLGLSMANSFMQGFGGSMRVECPPEKGASFILTLPTRPPG